MFAHTKYSIKYGIKDPEHILDFAQENQLPFLVICDINSTSAIISSAKHAQKIDFPIIAGVDVRNENQHCYFIVAENNRGFYELNSFLMSYLHDGIPFPTAVPYLANCKVVYPLENYPTLLRSNEFIGILPTQANRVAFLQHLPKDKLLATPVMTFSSKREYNTHRLLRAIDKNILLSQLSEAEHTPISERFFSYKELKEKYNAAPFLMENTINQLSSCHIHFGFDEQVVPQNLQTYTGNKEEDRKLVETLCEKGKIKRYPKINFSKSTDESTKITARIQQEINVIEQKGYLSYFLITWDIIHFAKSNDFFHVGRGSGANSIVAYLLDITDVDPLDLDLYFERFINLYRKNPPDFDIDFSWTERDEVLNYIFHRFEHTALIATYNTFKFRSCVRELGKVLGLPKSEIDKLSNSKHDWQQMKLDKINQLVLRYSSYIEGLPSHLSIHAGGVIIAERPVEWLSPTFLPPKGYPTVQFSMFEAEDIGLYKFDILSQRGLGKIKDCLDVIRYNQPTVKIRDIHDITFFKQDQKIQQILQTGEAMGCFYIESPAMRMLMKKLKTKTYLELVAASSIIRPGVASSGMMHEYIRRHISSDLHTTGHPLLLELMPETYGIMVYQEDVMKVAHYFADLTLDEADILRRGMSGKYRSRGEFTEIQNKFFENCKKKGYDEQLVQTIWHQIESFAGYAFSKGHSASYAVESFQSLYLKAYFPLEYMVAVINNFGGFYRTEFYVREAQKLGATIEPPCIQNSNWETVIRGTIIYLGFQHIIGIDYKEVNRILKYRNENGRFNSFEGLLHSTYPTLENLLLLIRINAFRELFNDKQVLKWKAHLFYKKEKVTTNQVLFTLEKKQYTLPPLEKNDFEQTFEELELLGFTLCNPFDLLTSEIQTGSLLSSIELKSYEGQIITLYGYLVTVKYVRTKHGEMMSFGTFQDYYGEIFDTVHFSQTLKAYPFRGRGIYKISGKVVNDFECYSVEVHQFERQNERENELLN